MTKSRLFVLTVSLGLHYQGFIFVFSVAAYISLHIRIELKMSRGENRQQSFE